MRVLIFSTNTGQGHNGASNAVKEYLTGQGVDALVLDVLDTGRKKSETVSKLYDAAVTRVPGFFGGVYAFAEWLSSSKRHSPVYWANSWYAGSLYRAITLNAPDVIVCPHMFSAHAVTWLKKKRGLNIPTVGIITDYTWSPFWEESALDYYIVPNEVVADECAKRGMDREKMLPLGIPVSAKYNMKSLRESARAKFGITKEKAIAIMGGSMGYGKIPQIALELAVRLPDVQILAVCGNNQATYEKAKEIPGVMTLGFIDNVDVLMDAVDVLLTKPGGLSATEAITKRAPLILTLPIPGGEERNADMLAKMGMAITTKTVEESVNAACELLQNRELRNNMKAAQIKFGSITAAKDIGDLIMEMAMSRQEVKEEVLVC
ncbi:MAG: glycosyltransferase [Oscillospiraceae bacterium]|nr:glycosyltransferase [Oscillospiraceae bacterium]